MSGAILTVLDGHLKGGLFHVVSDLTIGSEPGCGLRLDDRGVAARHATLRWLHGRATVVPHARCVLEGEPISAEREHIIPSGSLLEVGTVTLLVSHLTPTGTLTESSLHVARVPSGAVPGAAKAPSGKSRALAPEVLEARRAPARDLLRAGAPTPFGNLLRDVDGACVAALLDLSTREALFLKHTYKALSPDAETSVVAALVAMLTRVGLEPVEGLLFEGGPSDLREGFHQTSQGVYLYQASRLLPTVCGVLVGRRETNRMIGALKLREAVELTEEHAHRRSGHNGSGPTSSGLLQILTTERMRLAERAARRTVAEAAASRPGSRRKKAGAEATIAGDAGTLGLSNVFQIVSQERRSGLLKITAPRRTLSILLEEGRILSAWHENVPVTEGLGRLLVVRNELTLRDLAKARSRAEESGRELAAVLLEEELVPKVELQDALAQIVADRIFPCFTWPDAHFELHTGEQPHLDWFRPIDVSQILFQGALIVDELPRVRAVFPSDDVAVRVAVHAEKIEVSERGRDMLRLVPDHWIRIRKLRERSPEPYFDVYRLLLELAHAGRIEVQESKPPPSSSRTPSRRRLSGKAKLGRRLRELRVAADISAAEAARRLGVDPGLWKDWEQGRKAIPHHRHHDIVALLPETAELFGGDAEH